MKTVLKISLKRELVVSDLLQKASNIFNENNWEGNWCMAEWESFMLSMYRSAKYNNKDNWKWECEELFLNLTR